MLRTINNIDFIRRDAFYLPAEDKTPEKLEQLHRKFDEMPIGGANLAWHLRDTPLLPPLSYWNKRKASYLIAADQKISRKVQLNYNYDIMKGTGIIYSTTTKRGHLKILKSSKDPSYKFEYIKYMEGINTTSLFDWNGNSLLFQITPSTYMEITGDDVFTYTLPEGEEIQVYYSPIQCEYFSHDAEESKWLRSPHAFAVTTQNRILYRGQILDNSLPFPPTPFFSLQYSKYLQQMSSTTGHYAGAPNGKYYRLPAELYASAKYNPSMISLNNLLPLKNPFVINIEEQLKLVPIEYGGRLNPRFLHVSEREVIEKTNIQPNSHLAFNMPEYQAPVKLTQQIMVNGYCNFELRVNQLPPPQTIDEGNYQTLPEIDTNLTNYQNDGVIRIYNQYKWQYIPIINSDQSAKRRTKEIQNFYGSPCFTIQPEEYLTLFLGFNGDGQDHYWLSNNGHGNTILIHMADNSYIQIDSSVTRFSLPDPNDRIKVYYSPIGPNGVPYPWALTEKGYIVHEGRYIPGDQFSLPKTPFYSYLVFQQIYGNISNLAAQDPNQVQTIQEECLVTEDD